jgi:hypothetical protein
MISRVRTAEILRCARQVVSDNGFTSLPVDPKEIARRNDIEVHALETKTLGVSGVLMKVGDDFAIGYSTAIKNFGFENFTVAHELGHYFLDGHVEALLTTGTHYSRSGYLSNDVHEKEADLFASELLMPEFLMRPAIARGGSGFALIQRLAEQGCTSVVATAIRYAKLAEDPVAVILSEEREVRWCFLSDCLSECRGVHIIGKGSILPPDSPTHGFNSDRENIVHGVRIEESTSLRTWFENAPDIEVQEDVVGLGHYGKTLTVLFTEAALDADEGRDWDYEERDEGADVNLPSVRRNTPDRWRY